MNVRRLGRQRGSLSQLFNTDQMKRLNVKVSLEPLIFLAIFFLPTLALTFVSIYIKVSISFD